VTNLNLQIIKENILSILQEERYINACSLMGKLSEEVIKNFTHEEVQSALLELEEEKKLVALNFILGSMNYRVKTIYFQEGTNLLI
jgi:hypothetical protein